MKNIKAANKRKHARHEYDIPIELVFSEQRSQQARLINISLGGAFIEADPLPPFGGKVKLRITIPGVPERCEIPCIVRWTKSLNGAGLQFEHLRAIEVWALNKLLNLLSATTKPLPET